MDAKLIRQIMQEEQERLDTFLRQKKQIKWCGFQQMHDFESLSEAQKTIKLHLNAFREKRAQYNERIAALREQVEYLEQLEHDKAIYDEATVHWKQVLKANNK